MKNESGQYDFGSKLNVDRRLLDTKLKFQNGKKILFNNVRIEFSKFENIWYKIPIYVGH